MLKVDYLHYPPINLDVFPQAYVAARRQFGLSAKRIALPLAEKSYPCPGAAPDGEDLATDTLWIGSNEAENVMVLLAGTHGVEGFVGSAVLMDHLGLIADGQLPMSEDTAILFVHALNPWGYAWLRRCDEEGVDLNRNAVDFSHPLPENPGYESLRNIIATGNSGQIQSAFANYEQQHGRTALEIAVSGGQFTDPAGPFYGGSRPAHGRLVSEDLIQQHQLDERNLAVIDIHSGIGSYGYGEIICDHEPGSPGEGIALLWYGDSVALPALGTSISVLKAGLMDYLWQGIMNNNSCYVTLEFGTYSTDQLFDVVLKDHALWAQQGNLEARQEHEQRMRHHFYPQDSAWQALVLFRARQVISQALHGLDNL